MFFVVCFFTWPCARFFLAWPEWGGGNQALFENLIRGEFHFKDIEEMDVIRSWEELVSFSDFDRMNWVDKDGLLAGYLKPN